MTFQNIDMGGFRELDLDEIAAVSGGANGNPPEPVEADGVVIVVTGTRPSRGEGGTNSYGVLTNANDPGVQDRDRASVSIDGIEVTNPVEEKGPVTISCCTFSAFGFDLDIDVFSVDVQNLFKDNVVVHPR